MSGTERSRFRERARHPHRFRPTRFGVIAALALALGHLTVAQASFATTTSNTGSSLTALTVAPPTAVSAVMTLNSLPLLTCKVALSWTASTTAAVTSYEVVRVRAATGLVDFGPWTVATTSTIDNPVPLQLIANQFEWRVRSILSSWRSAWQPATNTNLLGCLL